MENTAEVPLKKVKIELPYYLTIPLLDTYPEKTIIRKDTCTQMLICSIYNSRYTEATHMCKNRGMDKDVVSEMLAIEKNEIMPFAAT